MCPQVLILEESNIALFSFRFSFDHIYGGYDFDLVKEEQYLTSLLRRFCWTNLILHSFHVILVNLRGGFVDYLSLASCCVLGI